MKEMTRAVNNNITFKNLTPIYMIEKVRTLVYNNFLAIGGISDKISSRSLTTGTNISHCKNELVAYVQSY